jgi:hypothetical protein
MTKDEIKECKFIFHQGDKFHGSYFECSNCKDCITDGFCRVDKFNYCPGCGAKIKKEDAK